APGCVGDAHRIEFVGLCLLATLRLRRFPRADDDVETAVANVRRLRLALNAVADDGDGLALEDRSVNVGVAVNLFHDFRRVGTAHRISKGGRCPPYSAISRFTFL